MEIRALQTFVLVATEMNLHRAAELLGISQPAVTAQLAALESELGFDLFVRAKQRLISLTTAGQTYLISTQRVLAEMQNAAQRARQVARGKVGVLRVGMSEDVATARVLQMVARLRDAMPDAAFEFVEIAFPMLAEAVRRGDVDVAVTLMPIDSEGLTVQPLWREGWAVAMRLDHPLAQRASIAAEDLVDMPLIMGDCERSGDHVMPRGSADLALTSPRIVIKAQRRSTKLALVHAGTGVTFLPDFMIDLRLRDLATLPLRDAVMPIGMIMRAQGASAFAQRFLDLVRAEVACPA